MYRYTLILALAPLPAVSDTIDDFSSCLRAFTNFSSYIFFAEDEGSVLPARHIAAFDADFQKFIEKGIVEFGEGAIRQLVDEATEPDVEYIRSALAIHTIDGPERTLSVLAKIVAPCGGPDGHLSAVLAR